MYFLSCIIYLAITIIFPSLPLAFFIVFPFLILLFFYIVVTKFIKTPDLVDITSLGDRILDHLFNLTKVILQEFIE